MLLFIDFIIHNNKSVLFTGFFFLVLLHWLTSSTMLQIQNLNQRSGPE